MIFHNKLVGQTKIFIIFQIFIIKRNRRSHLICGVIFYVCVRFSTPLFIIFGVGLPAHLSNHNPFLREHIFVGFNEWRRGSELDL